MFVRMKPDQVTMVVKRSPSHGPGGSISPELLTADDVEPLQGCYARFSQPELDQDKASNFRSGYQYVSRQADFASYLVMIYA